MIILHLLAPAPVGGLERVVRALAEGHGDKGHDVHVGLVLARGSNPGMANEWKAIPGVTVHPVTVRRRGYGAERRAIGAICRRLRPDLLHTHGYRPDVIHGATAREAGIPVVSTHHGFNGGGWRNRLYQRLQVGALRRFDAVIAVSRPLTEELAGRGVPRDRLHCIQNAWVGSAPPLSKEQARLALGVGGKFCVGWVGRLSAEKHPELLLKALDLLRDLPICTAVLGEGRRRRALERRVQRAGLRERVRWCGVVPVAERLFPAFDAFVLSSRTEGTPMVLFEAIAAGVPVIATRVGGVPDLVTRREALLVESGDHVALADAIRNIYEDRVSAAVRARSAHERVEREFSYDAWLARYERLYASVVEIPSGADQVCN